MKLIICLALELYTVFAARCLYNWFLFPITHFELSYWHLFGLTLLISVITNQYTHMSEDEDKDYALNVFIAYKSLQPTVALIFGYIAKAFI